MMDDPECRLSAVRPGIALYRGAVRVTSPIVEMHEHAEPAGYTGFSAARHGVILMGYRHGLRMGPCLVNGARRRILEIGMQSSYIELSGAEKIGDTVTLLGGELGADELAGEWKCGAQEVMVSLLR